MLGTNVNHTGTGVHMQIIDKTLELPLNSLSAITAFLRSEKEKYCFFDIETTGLSARISSLYLIGTLWYDPDDQKGN